MQNIKNVLVTGGAGYIGSHVAKLLIENGYHVTIIDNLYSGRKDLIPADVKFYEGNVGDIPLVEKIIKENSIASVLHFAAHIEVPESVSFPLKYYFNNTVNTTSLLQACSNQKIQNFIFSSTAAVYGMPELQPGQGLTEETPPAPINPYGQSKLFSEHVLRDLTNSPENKHGFKHVILRYFNVAGARRDGTLGQCTPRATHLIKVACQTMLGQREKISVYGTDYNTPDGTCIRDYIHVEDLAEAHLKALQYLESGGSSDTFNCGYGQGFTVLEVLRTIEKVGGKKLNIEKTGRRAGDPQTVVANSNKAQAVLKWKPKYNDLDLICKTALDWERKIQS